MKQLERIEAAFKVVAEENKRLRDANKKLCRKVERITGVTNSQSKKHIYNISDSEIAVLNKVTRIVCEVFGLTEEQLKSKSRERILSDARAVAFKMLRDNSKFPYTTIGGYFQRDHSTIIHGIEKHNSLATYDKGYARLTAQCERRYLEVQNDYHIHEKMLFIGAL